MPEMGGESAGTSASRPDAGGDRVQGTGEAQRKRGRSPADKESKRLKRYVTSNFMGSIEFGKLMDGYLNYNFDTQTFIKILH